MRTPALLKKLYSSLYTRFGEQHWWPAETKFEVIAGAILTQQTSWKNVEKAIENLKKKNLLSAKALATASPSTLHPLIRCTGFYKQKTKRLIDVAKFFQKNNSTPTREQLLELNGVGFETADSILLYAFNQPVFVVDVYTKRLVERFPLPVREENDYETIRFFFQSNLSPDVKLFKEFHALIVELGKNFCKAKPSCAGCPLERKWYVFSCVGAPTCGF
ncbi:endonuclease III domain-containing protein [Candidatus Micrarchaeota archaeon]|nr:endonuclease III domain-containing protein [Candidatus Micrarchaeota archaeon]